MMFNIRMEPLLSANQGGLYKRGLKTQRRENMVGVNMVLAEFAKFKDGLYTSCGLECFEGIMLEPCFL